MTFQSEYSIFGVSRSNERLMDVIEFEINSFNNTKHDNLRPVVKGDNIDFLNQMSFLTYNKLLGFQGYIKNVLDKRTVDINRKVDKLYTKNNQLFILILEPLKLDEIVRTAYAVYIDLNKNEPYYQKLDLKNHFDSKGNIKPDSQINVLTIHDPFNQFKKPESNDEYIDRRADMI